MIRETKRATWALLVTVTLFLLPAALTADPPPTPTGSIAGRVTAADGSAASDARVRIVELNRRASVDADGRFRLDSVPVGTYLIEATSRRFGQALQRVTVTVDQPATANLALDLAVHRESVVVSASAEARGTSEVAQPTTVLEGKELQLEQNASLGETLARQPGVSSTSFGPAASRPVIRGLGGDRVRILESGIGVGDASNISPDHAVSTEPITTERIEILRGPATLLYGSSAVGGVINVLDERIPTFVPESGLSGTVNLRGGTALKELGGGVSVSGGAGPIAWHFDGSKRKTRDYKIPGFAKTEPEPGDRKGVVPNSAIDSDSLGGGLSFVGDVGFIGASYSGYNTEYGSPAEEEVSVDLRQRRFDARGEITTPFAFLRGVKVRFGKRDYKHTEFEGKTPGTVFTNDFWEGRLEAPHAAIGTLTGAIGVQFSKRDFAAIGEERFVPPTKTKSRAGFVFEELTLGKLRLQFGGRYESQDVDASEGPVRTRSFNGFSGAIGAVFSPNNDLAVALSVNRAVRLPAAEELYADGPHIATKAFEIGNPNLSSEKAVGADLSLRKRQGPVTGELTFFANRFDGYVFEQLTGETRNGLRVLRFTQRDSEFLGGELHTDVALWHSDPNHLALELSADYVRARLRDGGQPLPRIPAFRFGGGIRYQGSSFFGLVEVRRTSRQNRISEFETETPGYTFLNAAIGYRFFIEGVVNDLILRGTNLTDREARNHVSFLKDVAPLPGRDLTVSYRITF